MAITKHAEHLDKLLLDKTLWGKYTRKELADLLTNKVGTRVSEEQVRAVLRLRSALAFNKKEKTKLRERLQEVPRQTKPMARQNNTERVLVIGDIHEPFSLDEYLDFCVSVSKKFKTTHTIFIGDIIDNHYSSYHETDPNGLSAKDELDVALERVAKWYKAFPIADVCIGNHDRLIARKAQTSGIASAWLRDYNEVLGCPGWNFQESFEYDGVQYIHGEGGTARTKMRHDLQSTVQGHLHNQAYIEYSVGNKFRVFGMQVGCGVDRKSYAMAYGKNFKKPIISCGVVLDSGTQPMVIPMEL